MRRSVLTGSEFGFCRLRRDFDCRHGIERKRRRAPHRFLDVAGHAGAEHHGLEQRIGGKPVRAVRASRGHLAASPQAGDGGAAVRVGEHAAHMVVRRRSDRDRLTGRVDARQSGTP